MNKNYYDILEITKDSTSETIKKSYRKLSKLYHPDKTKDSSDERFKEINTAYTVLSNPQKRKQYDLKTFESSHSNFADFADFDYASMFDKVYSNRKTSIKINLYITLQESLNGTKRSVSIKNKNINVDISPNTKDGQTIQYNIENSPVVVHINLIKDANITIDNNDIILSSNLDLYTAILGGSLVVAFLDKNIKIKIPPYTQSNRIFRIKGKGYRNRLKTLTGDLLIKINIELPTSLTDEEFKLLTKLKEIQDENSTKDII